MKDFYFIAGKAAGNVGDGNLRQVASVCRTLALPNVPINSTMELEHYHAVAMEFSDGSGHRIVYIPVGMTVAQAFDELIERAFPTKK